MLHNTGHYGPNEAPINMGAPVNMTPMSGHMNLAHNINNLSKMAQQGVPPPSGHYNLPDYSHYNHAPIGMPSQMPQFPNYQHLGFQHTYMNQNANSANDLSFSNGMYPMNLNMQSEQNVNMMNNYGYDKRVADSMRQDTYKEENFRKMPLNIPQIPNKSFSKHYGGNDYVFDDNMYQDTQHNLDLSMKTQERKQIDHTRRKNIEHTVKLIENILIHSSNKPKDPPPSIPEIPKPTHIDVPSDMTIEKVTTTSKKLPGTTTIDPLALSPQDLTKEDSNSTIDKFNSIDDDSQTRTENENESQSEDEDVKPIGITEHLVPEDPTVKTDNSIVIKVEKASWADSECFTPFVKDCNGFERDDHHGVKIIDGECSVNEATAAYKNPEIKSEGCFECPHCALLFKHPKRFLIHNKWHTFGLTNEKRMEIAKEREQRRFEKKEARILEKISSQEVTDIKTDGKVFPCKDCDKVFSTKSTLRTHRQRDHPARIRECRICHKTISSWQELRTHLMTHSSDNGHGFQCSECPKRFKYSHSLAKHSDTHLEKVHACADCPKKFGSQKLLKMHMKTHERVLRGATFRCTYCGKGFFESYSLQIHERTHRNERPFLCEICNTSFGTNSSLKRHIKVSHNAAKPHECSVCHRNFSTESIRDRHEVRVHGNPEDFKFPCKLCACKYLKLKDLQKHVYKMHPKSKRKKKVKTSETDSE